MISPLGIDGNSLDVPRVLESQVKLSLFERQHQVSEHEQGQRLDQLVATVWSDFSRSRLSGWIKSGDITLNGRVVKPKHPVALGDEIVLAAEWEAHDERLEPQAMDLEVLYEDHDLLVINKPAGLVVHPGSGNRDGTLVNALLARDPALAALPRAGLVHRLDKDTTGCLLVAKTLQAHPVLVKMLKDRDIKRAYWAVVWGAVLSGGQIDAPMGRHPTDRRKQAIRNDGRPALTHFRLAQRLAGATWLNVMLDTGRTHQIRVHMAHHGYPIIGDPVYGRRGAPKGLTQAQRECWQGFPRQALHAHHLACPHPIQAGQSVDVHAPMPADMAALVATLDGTTDGTIDG